MNFQSVLWGIKTLSQFIGSHSTVVLYMLPFAAAGLLTLFATAIKRQGKLSYREIFEIFFPLAHWLSAATKVDVVTYIIQKFTQRWIVLLVSIISLYLATSISDLLMYLMPIHQQETGTLSLIILAISFFLFSDFGEFLSHYVQHKVPVLWEFHKVHHSATFLTPFTTYRFHPVGNFLDALFSGVAIVLPATAAAYLYGLSLAQLIELSGLTFILSTLFLLEGLQHSHFPIRFGVLEWVFISPIMHQVHHSVKLEHWDRNMGSRLAVWDVIFGTHFLLPKGETLKFGLGTKEDQSGEYQRVWWCYFGPFIRIFDKAVPLTRVEQPRHN